MSSDYGIDTPNGNLFLQKLHISPANATTFGNLPNSSSLNSKYWKKIYTDRSVTPSLQGSGMKNDGSFFIAGTFVGTKTAFPSVDGPTAITGNDIFNAIVSSQIEFDDFGNIRIFTGDGNKDWKNPLTPVKMAVKTGQLRSIDMPNSTFILSRNGRWILAQDTELSQKGADKVYYVMFNPIHSGGSNTEDPYYTTSSTFKKWYNSQVDQFGTKPDPNRLEEPLLQKYCEMTAQKPGNSFKTNQNHTTPFKTSFSEYIPQDGDYQRNYGDQSCNILVNKEGVYNAMGGIISDPNAVGLAIKDAVCNTQNGPNNYANSNRKGNFIIDYMNDKKKRAIPDMKCPERSINFCSTVIQAAGDVNIKGGSNIVNECGKQYPNLIPTPAPTTPAPTTLAPTTRPPTLAPTNAPTLAPTNAPTLAPTTRPPTTLAPTNAPTTLPPTLSPTKVPTFAPTTSPSTTPAPSSSNMMMMAIAGVAVVGAIIVIMKMRK
jgi:hypothetical protein